MFSAAAVKMTGRAPLRALEALVDYFEMPERKVVLSVRVSEGLKEQLQLVVELWQTLAEAKGGDPESINLTYVVERLLRVGVDGTWGQVGHLAGLDGMPKNAKEMARLKAAILREAQKPSHNDDE